MSSVRKSVRVGPLVSQSELCDHLVRNKGYRKKDLKIFFKDLEDVIVDELASGKSIHLFQGLYFEIRSYKNIRYDFKEKRLIDYGKILGLFFRATPSFKNKIFVNDKSVDDEEEIETDE